MNKFHLKIILAATFIFCTLRALSQTSVSSKDENVGRITELGKIWGVIKYFHPNSGKGNMIDSDSLFLHFVTPVINDGSEESFVTNLKGMLASLNDIHTKLIPIAETPTKSSFFLQYERKALKGNKLYISLPQNIFSKEISMDTVIGNDCREIILDFRCNEINNDIGLRQYNTFVAPLIAKLINSTMILPTERTVCYKGMMRQDFPYSINLFDPDKNGNMPHYQVNTGLKNISEGSYLFANSEYNNTNIKFSFVLNKFVNVNTVKAIMALKNRGLCYVTFDGDVPEYLYGSFYNIEVCNKYIARIKSSEVIYEDGTLGSKPDLILEGGRISQKEFIENITALFNTPLKENDNKHIENTVYIQKPVKYLSENTLPSASLRLLGLFNFWNAIHFFSPDKNLISVDWDNVLPYFVAKFLNADTQEKYFLALMELTASINDGHAIMFNTKTGRTPKNYMDGNLPIACDIIKGKVYITSIMPDKLQQDALAQFHYGDEIVSIDNIPAKDIIKGWEKLLVASNTSGFNRELYATWFTAGNTGSTATVRVVNKGKQKSIHLNRIDRNEYYSLWGRVPRKYASGISDPPYYKILKDNIGYIRLNKVLSQELDTIAYTLKSCDKIIIDARGYPKDSRIGTHFASYIATKKDTVAYDVFPFITSPDLSKNQELIEYAVIEPHHNNYLKNKKYYILVDEGNQSQGEWNIIALQGVTDAVTIGRTTAGANGMAVSIPFPGDYMSFFSGFAEYYPDHTPNQKLGVKIDVIVEKTLKGTIEGQDEILNRAKAIINSKL